MTYNPKWDTVFGLITFGQIYVDGGVTSQSIATGTTYAKVTCFNTAAGFNGASSDTTVDKANSEITCSRAGTYLVSFNMSLTSDTPNVVYRAAIFNDTVEQSQVHDAEKFLVGTDLASLHATGLVACTAGQKISVRIRHGDGGSVAITPLYAFITVRRVGT